MKRVLALVLLYAMLMMLVVPAALASDMQPYASPLIASTGISVRARGSGVVQFAPDIATIRSVDKLGFPSIEIEEYSGSKWKVVKTVTDKYDTNRSIYGYTVSYDGVIGRKYRAVVEFYAKDGSVTDTKNSTSSTLTAK